MPRKSKEKIELDEKLESPKAEKKVTKKNITKKSDVEKKTRKSVTSKSSPAKKSSKTTKQLTKTEKDFPSQEENTSNSSKEQKKKTKNETKTRTTTPNLKDKSTSETKNTSKKTSALKVSSKTSKPQKTASKVTTSKVSKRATSSSNKSKNKKKSVEIIEYYDLPYRYNQTVIKLLAQTPKSLFVYWDISDEDRKNFIMQYGENFFNETKPVLFVHNETMNYTFEVEINDFANSWYLKVNDADCIYKIELGRRFFEKPSNIPDDYIYITISNNLESPNDHILFNNLASIYLKNVKTNQKFEKKISDITTLKNIGKIYNIYDLYKKIYSEENISNLDLNNPSSGLSSSSFKI